MIANPLTEGDYKAINDALELAADLLPMMDKMERCGEDCQERKAKLADAVKRLEAFKKEFFKRGKPIEFSKG